GRDSLTAASLERLVRKETQQRHHQRRHAAALAAARLRLRLTARAIEHAVKNIRQSHDYLLLSDAGPALIPEIEDRRAACDLAGRDSRGRERVTSSGPEAARRHPPSRLDRKSPDARRACSR